RFNKWSKVELALIEHSVYQACKWNGKKIRQFFQRSDTNELKRMKEKLDVVSGSEYAYSRDFPIPSFNPRYNKWKFIEVKYYLEVRVGVSSLNLFGTFLTLLIPIYIEMDTRAEGPTRKYAEE
ncbi:hypothetical protein PMAYCL1PPCAC_02458, partial [Pristionchus mayeri]